MKEICRALQITVYLLTLSQVLSLLKVFVLSSQINDKKQKNDTWEVIQVFVFSINLLIKLYNTSHTTESTMFEGHVNMMRTFHLRTNERHKVELRSLNWNIWTISVSCCINWSSFWTYRLHLVDACKHCAVITIVETQSTSRIY